MTDTKMCPYCGEEVKLEAIKCKHCQSMLSAEDDALVGAPAAQARPVARQAAPKEKKPIWKRWWAWAAVIVVLYIFIVSAGDSGKSPSTSAPSSSTAQTTQEETPAPAPMVVTVDELVADLRDNALKAASTYKDQYVELTGRLSNIDSDGKYFSLGILSSEFSLDTVLCRIKSEHLDTVMNFSKDQEVTVTGKITAVGEVLGYTVQVETIK